MESNSENDSDFLDELSSFHPGLTLVDNFWNVGISQKCTIYIKIYHSIYEREHFCNLNFISSVKFSQMS